MAPLIHGLHEAAEWLAAEEGGGDGGGTAAAMAAAEMPLLHPADSWEWLTVCCYTCGASCEGAAPTGAGAALVEEEVQVANEEGLPVLKLAL